MTGGHQSGSNRYGGGSLIVREALLGHSSSGAHNQ